MGINRYMMPAEQPAMQSYVSQHVDLPTDELGKYFDRQQAQQDDMGATEEDLLTSEAFIEDQAQQQDILNKASVRAEEISNINPNAHPMQYKRALAKYKKDFATPLAALERKKEYKDNARKQVDKYGSDLLYFGGKRSDVADNIRDPNTGEWVANPEYDSSAQYIKAADYAKAYEAGIEDVEPNSYATVLTKWSGGKGYLTYDDVKSIDTDDMDSLIDSKFIEGQIAQRPELQEKLKTYLEKNNRNPHLTGADAYSRAIDKMVDESKSAFKDKLYREVTPHYIADKEYERGTAVAKKKAGLKPEKEYRSGWSVVQAQAAGYTMKNGKFVKNTDGKKGAYIGDEYASALYGNEAHKSTTFSTNEKEFYENRSKNKYLISKSEEAQTEFDINESNKARELWDIMKNDPTLADVPERFSVAGMIKYFDDTGQGMGGGTDGNYAFKNTVLDTYQYSTDDVAKKDHDAIKGNYKELYSLDLADGDPREGIHNPIYEHLTSDKAYTSKQKGMLDLYEKFGWDGKGLMLFGETKNTDGSVSIDRSKYNMSINPDNDSLKRAKAEITRLQKKFPDEKSLKYATAEIMLNTKLKDATINVTLGQDKDNNNFRISNGEGYLKNKGHMTATELVGLATSQDDAGDDVVSNEMLEVMIDKGIEYNWPEGSDKDDKVKYLIKLAKDEPKAITEAAEDEKKAPKRKEFIFNFTSTHNATDDATGNAYDRVYHNDKLNANENSILQDRRGMNNDVISHNIELGNQVTLMAEQGSFTDDFLVEDIIAAGGKESNREAFVTLQNRANNKALPSHVREDAKLALARVYLSVNSK